MRLIDADEVIKKLNDKIARLDAKQQVYMNNGLISIADTMARKIELCIECRELLEHQPTSYNVEKVIKELEEYQGEAEQFNVVGMLADIIEVVKAGETDD